MDRETSLKFDRAIDFSINKMLSEVNQLIALSQCKPLNIDQQGGLRLLETMLAEQIEKAERERNVA